MTEYLQTDNFADTAAKLIISQGVRAVTERGAYRLALSGGNTPKAVYQKIAELAPDISKWIVTFGDERCVPPDDAQSNFHMANEAWLKGSRATVLRMKGEIDPAEAARDYEQQLAEHGENGKFCHDLVLLGIGDDGHTASLFPGSAALAVTDRDVVENFVPKLKVWRLTFTFPYINSSRAVMFLVNDAKKQPIIDAIKAGGTEYPSEQIKVPEGKLTWLLGE